MDKKAEKGKEGSGDLSKEEPKSWVDLSKGGEDGGTLGLRSGKQFGIRGGETIQ